MPRRFIDPKTAQNYKLVHKNYDDPEYETEDTKMTLVRREKLWRTEAGALFKDPALMDMHTADDTLEGEKVNEEDGPDVFFEGAQWEEFDQDWIREMMIPGEDDEEEVDEDFVPPKHSEEELRPTNDFERLFEQELAKFDMDYGVEKDDPRTQGALDIADYEGALQEWEEDTKTYTFMNASEYPQKEEAPAAAAATDATAATQPEPEEEGSHFRLPSAEKLREMAFHADAKGVFLTTLTSSKMSNIYAEYASGLRESNKLTKQLLQVNPDACLMGEESLVQDPYADQKPRMPEFDVETVLSTYSNLENHPHLIKETGARIKITQRGLPKVEGQATSSGAEGKEEHGSDSDTDSDDSETAHAAETQRLVDLVSQTSAGRPKDETPEERRQRKELVKLARKMRREQKRGLKDAFKVEEWSQRNRQQRENYQRRTVKLF
eukprot:TRINITY_DN3273_c0_g1_i1.p1 TRINITY_DN3273_c0_g1~~TRINITY_DN3273_c0_g1_i1.p1  ORF type:complete len:436 (-),score=104.25 TRINITY_DN3273_c0_g1_i1:569-1876(-)